MTVVSVCELYLHDICQETSGDGKGFERSRVLHASAISVHCQLARTSPPARVYQSLSSVTLTEEKLRQGQMGTITSPLIVSVCFIGMTSYATCVLLMQLWVS